MRPGMIEVTGVPLADLVRAAYYPSRPQGLGVFHYQPGDLSDDEVAAIVERGKGDRMCAVSMDYVKGRSCKFTVSRADGGKLFIKGRWYDHSDEDLRNLLLRVGLSTDLLDKARAEEFAYEQDCIAEALSFLMTRDGSFVDKSENELPDKVSIGLYMAQDKGLVKMEWTDRTAKWSMLKMPEPSQSD